MDSFAALAPRLALNPARQRVWGLVLKNRVRELRTERGWTQTDFGGRVGVSRQSVHSIEIGKYDPSLPLAFKIADLFEMTIEDVFENPAKH